MDFLDNVVKSSNALLKDRLNNPFGKQQAKQDDEQQLASTTNAPNEPQPTNNNQTTKSNPNASNEQSTASQDQAQSSGEDLKDGDRNSQFAAIAADAEAVTQKAVKGAKNIGTFLFSMANKAGQTVSQTAKQVKQAVENTSILTDFTKEQQEFIKEHGGAIQAGELPWETCADESKAADFKEQILSLSQDKRNFVRSPPNDTNFLYDSQQCYPVALSLLREDPNLSKMRYELVPKLVNEDTFWRNYFYRVSMLKQMCEQGADIKQQQGWSSSRSSSGEGPDEITTTDEAHVVDASRPDQTKTPQQSFKLDNVVSTASEQPELESDESRKLVAEADDLKSRLRELNIGSLDGADQDDNDKWEEELQKDLQEFELISGDVSTLDEEVLDKEIMELERSRT